MALIRSYKKISPRIDASAFIAENAAVIGDVHVGAGSSVWFGCTLRGDVAGIRIGARSNIQDHTIIHESSKPIPTTIGDDVTVGHACLLHACTVGDGAFIGMQACVMDGAVVEAGAMLAAGALLTPGKIVPSGQLWGGSPAKFMRALTDEDREHMRWSAAHYVDLAGDYKV
ncbi:MAG: gamma carbonic anhydrase family protein [Proteobacteria bacterium]|nr:gamma carbonic anhydrase family protein [Pseudomonadota bacterium]